MAGKSGELFGAAFSFKPQYSSNTKTNNHEECGDYDCHFQSPYYLYKRNGQGFGFIICCVFNKIRLNECWLPCSSAVHSRFWNIVLAAMAMCDKSQAGPNAS
jgi:hypothetical protein